MTTMFCLSFNKNDASKQVCYTGTVDGKIYVWKDNQLEEILPQVHESSIFTLVELPKGFATAGKDGLIRTWDSTFHPIETINLRALLDKHEHPELSYSDGLFLFEFIISLTLNCKLIWNFFKK
jgi:WD40 repeat protein